MLSALRTLTVLTAFFLLSACTRVPRPQHGGGSTTTLGGATAPTTVVSTAPENSQTPTLTTIEKTTERTYDIPHETGGGAIAAATSSDQPGIPRREHLETAPSREAGSRGVPVAAPISPRIMREVITEKASTQVGTSQDFAGIVKAWGSATAAHYKSILWCLVLAVAAWTAWKRDWPLIAAILGVGSVISLLVAWWVGPVAVGAAALVWAAFHVARAQIPTP